MRRLCVNLAQILLSSMMSAMKSCVHASKGSRLILGSNFVSQRCDLSSSLPPGRKSSSSDRTPLDLPHEVLPSQIAMRNYQALRA